MATVEDLDSKPISEMSTDEALELLRTIRLSRRTQKASPKKKTSRKPTKAKKEDLTKAQAKALLDILGG